MTKAVFTTRVSPSYDDLPELYYHFPKQYLKRVEETVGDWIVYYEPSRTGGGSSRREGRKVYFATAKITGVRNDPDRPGHYYADIAEYLEFDNPVPFRLENRFFESSLRRKDGETATGVFQNAVRRISDEEFDGISKAGFAVALRPQEHSDHHALSLREEPAVFDRPIVERLVKRPFRDAAFTENVRSAYDATCAFTGLRLINGGGRCEIEAAHIRPVGDGHNGPDSVRNGIALSRTIHWMFDRGHLALTDSHEILIAEKYVPESVRGFIRPNRKIILPADAIEHPHKSFLAYHREHIFKGN